MMLNLRSTRQWTLRLISLTVVLIAAGASSAQLQAQREHTAIPAATATFDLQRDREPLVSLDGLWRFHPGDDPDGSKGWARPDFDDSAWPQLRSDSPWSEHGY